MNKFIYLHVVQGYYGQGWEDVAASEDRREARSDLKAYRTNCTYPYRIIRRREPNPQHSGGE
jgi:hypothetical protein